jgi:asparagine synthase (glutamine-hydrolysing)
MRHAVWMGSFSPKTKKRLYAQGRRSQIDQNALDRLVCGHLASVETEQNWERHQAQDIRLYLADNILTKTDRASMMYSLEARSPLMDYRVAEYAARLPPGLKYRGRTSKLLLRSLAARHLPPKIASRPKKGFGIPVAHWIKGALRSELTEYCSQSFVKRQGYFDPDQVERQLKDHLSGQVDRRKELWTYYVFQKWHEHVFAHR